MVKEGIIEDMIRVARALAQQGWFPGSSGNLSVIDRKEMIVYIKATGRPLEFMGVEDIVITDINGKVLHGTNKPSKEIFMHIGIYQVRDDINAVIHGHPPYSTAFAIKGEAPPLVTGPAKSYLRKIPIVEWAPSGSLELAKYVTETFKDKDVKVALLKNHGVVCGGKDIYDAYVFGTWLEDNSRVAAILKIIQ